MGGIFGVISTERRTETAWKSMLEAYSMPEDDGFSIELGLYGKMGVYGKHSSQAKNAVDVAFTIISVDGKIYNLPELRQEISVDNSTKSLSEAEILLQVYHKLGVEGIKKAKGKFSLAIWDEEKAKLILFRDRVGFKPLYYYQTSTNVYFSTELKGIRPFIDAKKWNSQAIQHYFRLGYIPAPYTIYEGVTKLPEASFVEFSIDELLDGQKQFSPVSYWTLENQVKKEVLTDENQAKSELKELLLTSVQEHTSGTSNLGAFLSGGIDSSLITALTKKELGLELSTFSIGFTENSHNESEYAAEVAKLLGTKHHSYSFTPRDAQDLIRFIPKWYEQPYGDSSALPSFLAAQKASEKSDVVLTGDGGDEQFMGYGMYTWADRLFTLQNSRAFIKTLLRLSPKLNHKRASNYFDYGSVEHVPSHIFSVDQGWFSGKELSRCFTFLDEYKPLDLDRTGRKLLVSEEQALFDLKYYLPGDLTVKVDRVAEQFQLDTRSPLLDHQLIEWSLNLSEKLKRKEGSEKYLLKQVLYDYLPSSLFERPKWGFGIPLGNWLQNDLKSLLDEYVNAETLSKYEFYKVDEIMALKSAFLNGKTYLYHQLWLVIVFNMWAEEQEV